MEAASGERREGEDAIVKKMDLSMQGSALSAVSGAVQPLELAFESLVPTAAKSRTTSQGASLTVCLSHDGKHVAVGQGKVVSVFTSTGLVKVSSVALPGPVGTLAWSSDDVLVLTKPTSGSAALVMCPGDPAWTCNVDEGLAGMSAVRWVPGQHSVVSVADLGMHASVWQLHSGASTALPAPKNPACLAFAQGDDGQWCALLSRSGGKDYLQWFDVAGSSGSVAPADGGALWTPLGGPITPTTTDGTALIMCPGGQAVWVLDYAVAFGVQAWGLDGSAVAVLSPPAPGGGLGAVAATASLSPSGTLLTVPCHSGPVLVFNALSHALVGSVHPASTPTVDGDAVPVFVGVSDGVNVGALVDATTRQYAPLSLAKWRGRVGAEGGRCDLFAVAGGVVGLEALTPSAVHDTSPPRLGATSHAAVSACDSFLAVVCASMPRVVWVHSTTPTPDTSPASLGLVAVLAMPRDVTGVTWDATAPQGRLLVACGVRSVGVWEPAGTHTFSVGLGEGESMVVRRLEGGAGGDWLLYNRKRWSVGHVLQGGAETL